MLEEQGSLLMEMTIASARTKIRLKKRSLITILSMMQLLHPEFVYRLFAMLSDTIAALSNMQLEVKVYRDSCYHNSILSKEPKEEQLTISGPLPVLSGTAILSFSCLVNSSSIDITITLFQ